MEQEVEFTRPGAVRLVPFEAGQPSTGEVLVTTTFSGISAGTELGAFSGTNPYLNKCWDERRRLFVEGTASHPYPVRGWGYEEVGRVTQLGPGVDDGLLGVPVWGIWGHRSAAVLPAANLRGHQLAAEVDPVCGVFARPGAVAMNALLDADAHPGETMVIFGQGVIGLLLTALASAAGVRVMAVDPSPTRLRLAERFGADTVMAEPSSAAEVVRSLTGDRGADVAVEISGNYRALGEAIRCVGLHGLVVVASFYQGEVRGLNLGEEFHHNRVRLVSSQVGAVKPSISHKWTRERLHKHFMSLVNSHQLDPSPLVTHRIAASECQAAYDLLSAGEPDVFQVVLQFAG